MLIDCNMVFSCIVWEIQEKSYIISDIYIYVQVYTFIYNTDKLTNIFDMTKLDIHIYKFSLELTS